MTGPNFSELHRTHVATMKDRYTRALEASGHDAVVVFAGAPRVVFADDEGLPFKALGHFESWLPLNDHPYCSISFRPGEQPRLAYYQPDDYWHLPPADPEGFWAGQFEIDVFSRLDEMRTAWPADPGLAIVAEPRASVDFGTAGELNPARLLQALDLARTVKTPYELACLRAASARGVRGHLAAADAFAGGGSEYEIHLAYLAACEHVDDELPYHSIVALNEHGAILHYGGRDLDRPGCERHSLLIDAGARENGYASDITRTYAAGPPEFGEMVDALDVIQRGICAALRPGLDYRDVNAGLHHDVAGLLADFELIDVAPDTAVAQGLTSTFLPHGLGHFIGIQVHDVAGQVGDGGERIPPPAEHPFLRLTRRLEAGNVLTVEPGVYFIGTLLDKLRATPAGRSVRWGTVDQFRKYGGVRIEDNVHITADGAENLTREAFSG